MAEHKFGEEEREFVATGETVIEDDVVASLAGLAAREIEGVANLGKSSVRRTLTEHLRGAGEKTKVGVDVEVGKKEAIVDLALSVVYGFNIPDIVAKVRNNVASRLLEITGLTAKEINIHVVGIEFAEKVKEKGEHTQPRVE